MSAWPPSLVNQSVLIQLNAEQTAFGTEKVEMGLARRLRGKGRGGGGYAFPFTALILYLRLSCRTLYINRNGFRPA